MYVYKVFRLTPSTSAFKNYPNGIPPASSAETVHLFYSKLLYVGEYVEKNSSFAVNAAKEEYPTFSKEHFAAYLDRKFTGFK